MDRFTFLVTCSNGLGGVFWAVCKTRLGWAGWAAFIFIFFFFVGGAAAHISGQQQQQSRAKR